ncbi:LLM class flavin-dependent oxidoreductase [Amycolatopsis decaplanina]|uniref:Coenzyme F420-dependent N5 N10-methylene tetrahydromethanopterin reductase-like protein n=1 Tax=Amycolatopsis decaplanina DSM 44594 TaxID=1284240 RepID=M2ZB99_9PSEU|nr:LLM class flavin-dependent oxidoreductase [Amycolatopsis decaplanina]EME57639.1 coenzyme F420-dependent N5 N10-methylene tetrahydromethanopterin reductase-like protein [Amycolatopsis decaplanina DSM 44594]
MHIGIGLPTNIPGARPDQVVEWARRAEACGFASVAAIDRLVYDSYEPLISLAAAAAVTDRIKLATTAIVAPCRGNAVLLAKQAASVHQLSRGRLVLGLVPGGRRDDYASSPVAFEARGRQLDVMLQEIKQAWAEETGESPCETPPELVLGGFAPQSFRRAARYGSGWIAGANGLPSFRQGAAAVRAAWRSGGRSGAPRLHAICYFSLGRGAPDRARSYLLDYYSFTGPFADRIADIALTDVAGLRATIEDYRAAGNDELILLPVNPDPEQVDLLAHALRDQPDFTEAAHE